MPKRKRRSFGSIKRVSRDKHVIRWTDNAGDGPSRRTETVYGSYADAAARLAEIQTAIRSRGDGPSAMTVGEAYRRWFVPWMERRLADGKMKANTAKLYRTEWERCVGPAWRDVPLSGVRPERVQEWLLGLTAANASVSIVVARKVGDFAAQFEVWESNRFRMPYEMPSSKAHGRSRRVYSLAEAEEAWERVRGTPAEPPFLLACFGSARTGESLGVRAEEVRAVEMRGMTLALVPIVRRMEAGPLPLPDGDLKNPQSMRTIVVPPPYSPRVLELASDGREWIAPARDGGPMGTKVLSHAWNVAVGDMRIPFANLRNSWRTIAQHEWGVDYETLEQLMGHKLEGVTGAHYLRPTPEQLANSFSAAYSKFYFVSRDK